jgi:phage head maturation protease
MLAAMFKRFVQFRAEKPADGELTRLRILASTDDPVDMGGWRESLSHAEGAIDIRTAAALLINHDPNRIAGVIRSCSPNGKQMEIDAELDGSARMESGMTVARAVEIGALRSASVGYSYDRKDCKFDEQTRTVTVNKWRLLELSLTPTPADASAGIRSIPHDLDKDPSMDAPAPVIPQSDPAPAIMAEQRQVAELARSLKLDAADYVGQALAVAKDAMLAEISKRGAEQHKEPAHPITITVEDTDKQVDAFHDAYAARVFGTAPKSGNPYAGKRLRQMASRFARFSGIKTDDWSDKDEAHFALGEVSQVRGFRDAANVIQSNFPNFVFLNAITKIVAKGFEMAPKGLTSASGAAIYETQMVPDFKSYTVGGMGVGNLIETAENTAFPELTKTEGAYSNTAKMWGGTLSMTLQAMISDDTGQFDRALRQAGPIAQKTMDRRLVQKFLRGIATTDASTWTGNTTSSTTPVWTTADTLAAARANVGKVNAALQAKIGLDGNPTGNMVRFLLAGPTAGGFLAGLLNVAPGQTVMNAVSGGYELVITPWLEAAALTGYSSTTYYGIADPNLATGLILSKITGYENIQVQEYDAGAVGARKFKLWVPFEADLFWAANSAGTSTIFAAQQATT